MANYNLLKADIDEKVYENAQQKITGANLNSVLNAMVTTLGAEYQFAGVATIDTNPGTPDAKVFYFANGKGTYTNFGSIEVTEDEVVVLYWDTAWHKEATGIASNEKLTELEGKVGKVEKSILTTNNTWTTLFSGLDIAQGTKIRMVLNFNAAWQRVIVTYNNENSKRVVDLSIYFEEGVSVDFITSEQITSFEVYVTTSASSISVSANIFLNLYLGHMTNKARTDELYDAAVNDASDVMFANLGTPTAQTPVAFIDNARITSYGDGSDNVASYNGLSVSVFKVKKGDTYRFFAKGGGDDHRPACLARNLVTETGALTILEKYGSNVSSSVNEEELTITPSKFGYLYVSYKAGVQASVNKIDYGKIFVDKVSGLLRSPLSSISIGEKSGSIYLERLSQTFNTRVTSYGSGSDQVTTYSGSDASRRSVSVYRVKSGVTYIVPSYGTGEDRDRNVMLASNYVQGIGVLTKISVYGEAKPYGRQILSVTPSVDCYMYVQYDGQKDDRPYYVGSADAAGLKLGYVREETLNGKKWAVFGDSFTAGATGTKFNDGLYKGEAKTYPFFIGNRTGIDVYWQFFKSGRTLAYPADGTFSNSITNPADPGYYQNVPEDVDYITFYIGINDGHHRSAETSGDSEDNTGIIPLGTITDTTTATYYGAWNVVLTWLIKNRPFAHIGIIVSNGVDTPDYRTAQIAIARKYGIPFIDLNGDDRTPCMIRSVNESIDSSIRWERTKAQAVDISTNTHPNDAAHEYESHFIEHFLRSL